MAVVTIDRVEAIPVRIPRDLTAATGTAGTPTTLTPNRYDYRWSETYEVLYPVHFEATLVKLTTSDGRRVSAADGFLTQDVRDRANLTVVTGAHVTGVTFDGNRATGVTYARGQSAEHASACLLYTSDAADDLQPV